MAEPASVDSVNSIPRVELWNVMAFCGFKWLCSGFCRSRVAWAICCKFVDILLVACAIAKLVCRFHLAQGCTRKLTKIKIGLNMTSAGLDHAASGFQAKSSIPEISPIRSTDQNNNLIELFTPLFFRILTRFRSY